MRKIEPQKNSKKTSSLNNTKNRNEISVEIQQHQLKFMGKSGIAKKELYMNFRVHLQYM